jgi:hypothetical protein
VLYVNPPDGPLGAAAGLADAGTTVDGAFRVPAAAIGELEAAAGAVDVVADGAFWGWAAPRAGRGVGSFGGMIGPAG